MTRLLDRVGEPGLRAIIMDFYDHVFGDVMIGFLFVGKDKATLIERELEFVAGMLGGDRPYLGRPIRAAHAKSPITGGHFARRAHLLLGAMQRHGLDAEVQAAWIAHNDALRPQVTADRGSECVTSKDEPPLPDPDRPIRLGRR